MVEDDAESRATTSFLLEREGYAVLQAEHGKAALSILEGAVPDLIISGLGMPVMDGRTFLHHIGRSANHRAVPVVILTSADSDDNEAELLKLGVKDFVPRNKAPEVFLQRVQRAITRS